QRDGRRAGALALAGRVFLGATCEHQAATGVLRAVRLMTKYASTPTAHRSPAVIGMARMAPRVPMSAMTPVSERATPFMALTTKLKTPKYTAVDLCWPS